MKKILFILILIGAGFTFLVDWSEPQRSAEVQEKKPEHVVHKTLPAEARTPASEIIPAHAEEPDTTEYSISDDDSREENDHEDTEDVVEGVSLDESEDKND